MLISARPTLFSRGFWTRRPLAIHSLRRECSRRTQRLKGTYSVFKIRPINPHAKFEDQVDAQYSFEKPIHSGNLQYRVALNPSTALTASGGIIALDNGPNYTFTLNLDKRLGTYFWMGAGYSRSLQFQAGSSTSFAQGLGSNGFYDYVVVHLQGQPTQKTAIKIDTTLARDAGGHFATSNKAFMGRFRFDYRLTRPRSHVYEFRNVSTTAQCICKCAAGPQSIHCWNPGLALQRDRPPDESFKRGRSIRRSDRPSTAPADSAVGGIMANTAGNSLSIFSLLDALRRRKFIVIIPAILLTVGFSVFAHFQQDRYRATATIAAEQTTPPEYLRHVAPPAAGYP